MLYAKFLERKIDQKVNFKHSTLNRLNDVKTTISIEDEADENRCFLPHREQWLVAF